MKKLFVCKVLLMTLAVTYQVMTVRTASANTVVSTTTIDNYIENIYSQIDFKGSTKVSEEVFKHAYKGYLNLLNAGKLSKKNIITICDFSLSSTKKRMWVIDLKTKKVILNDYVAHGQGSGKEYATVFSNTENSHQSSLGFYVTGNIYSGEHGASLKLHGMDNGYNSAAYNRAIVIHGADYVCTDLIKAQNYLGRSWGCPAVSNQVVKKLIHTINDGSCLFIYASNKKYLAKGYWLNKKIETLPEQDIVDDLMLAANTNKPVTYVYDVSAADIAPPGAQIVSVGDDLRSVAPATSSPFNFPFIWKWLP